MSATLQKAEVGPATGKEGAQSFARIAELVQRYLGCEAAVLTVNRPLNHGHNGALRRTAGSRADGCRATAAFRAGGETCAVDLRTLTNPLVAGEMGMRFYAGLPLRDGKGSAIGMLAAMDQHERTLAPEELDTLKLFAGMVSDVYEMQRIGHAA
jgi:GAF domain-containing protein